MPNNEMDYSLIHRTPDGNGKILVTTPGSPDKGSWETEAELKTYVNQRVVKHTADLPGTTTPINAAQLNGVPDSGFVKKYSQSPADWDTVPTNGSNKPVTSDGVYDAINAISRNMGHSIGDITPSGNSVDCSVMTSGLGIFLASNASAWSIGIVARWNESSLYVYWVLNQLNCTKDGMTIKYTASWTFYKLMW